MALEVLPIRGNVQTRLAKLNVGEFDAIVLAHAGILRLEMTDLPHRLFPLDEMIPAPGQGALGIEVRSDNAEAMHAIASLNDAAARLAATAERKVLSELHGGCLAPIACHAKLETSDQGTELCLRAIVMSADGKQRLQEDARVFVEPNDADLQVAEAHELGTLVAKRLRDKGADTMISTVRDNH